MTLARRSLDKPTAPAVRSPYWTLAEILERVPAIAPDLKPQLEEAAAHEGRRDFLRAVQALEVVASALRKRADQVAGGTPLRVAGWHVLFYRDLVKRRMHEATRPGGVA